MTSSRERVQTTAQHTTLYVKDKKNEVKTDTYVFRKSQRFASERWLHWWLVLVQWENTSASALATY